jgi:predicted Zn-dependent protease
MGNGFQEIEAMAMDVSTFRKLVALDPEDPLNRFGLGKKLFESQSDPASLAEAAEHLQFANARSPEHLATYHILGQVLIKLGRKDEARQVLQAGCEKTAGIGEGMGRDLGPAMAALLASL